MILAFDLDDTLYEEITYVKSSLSAVAFYLSQKFAQPENDIYQAFLEVLDSKGRGAIFDEVLKDYNLYSKAEVKRCLGVYRNNTPKIELSTAGKECLNRFSHYRKYLVTDGNKLVQTNKIRALGLKKHFVRTLPTHHFGIINAKPSTYVFKKILVWEQAVAQEMVYIGDNPHKDFVNLKKEGIRTIRVKTGMFKDINLNQEYEADHCIETLDALTEPLLKDIFKQYENR
ncbi:MAG: HAD family hydrolase [Cyclobacteriaceae bacterium]|nr:HAD family hydrolase [Cyclobacteriaceae bacterium HetDA_MAG_MS6]